MIAIHLSLLASRRSADQLDTFLNSHGLRDLRVKAPYHITLCRVLNPSTLVKPQSIQAIRIASLKTRFMILVKNGDDPRHGRSSDDGKLGIRFQACPGRSEISELRKKYLLLGDRGPEPLNFKPHMALLKPGAIETENIRDFGEAFRSSLQSLSFDRVSAHASLDNRASKG